MRALALAAAALLLLSPATAHAEFGIEPGSFTASPFTSAGATGFLGEGAGPDAQASDHPYEITTSFSMNTTSSTQGERLPDGGDTREVVVQMPLGVVGDPNATPHCSQAILRTSDACPNDTVVGVMRLNLALATSDKTFYVPVYNMSPSRGELAVFGFHVSKGVQVTAFIHVRVRSTSDYGVTATVSSISQIGRPIESAVTLWGVPADPSHDPWRGSHAQEGTVTAGCVQELSGESTGSCPSDAPPRALLRDPTACEGPSTTALHVDSWQRPGLLDAFGEPDLTDSAWRSATVSQPALTGCEKLVFNPSIEVTPETTRVDSPSGYTFNLHVPQSEDPYGLATPDLRDATVTLPPGVAISPAGANGLAGCTPTEIGLHTENPVTCPDASKLGTVRVQSPDLPRNADGSEGAINGSVYLGAPASGQITAPPYTIYLLAEGYGLTIRLQGTVGPNPLTGQLTTTFSKNPQLPFDDLELHLFGGPRAALATPPDCGSYTTTSQLVPYSSQLGATPSATFATSFDGGGAPCPSPLPFAPSFTAGSTSTAAGAFSSFVLNISRPDDQQALSGISLTTPPGISGMLSSVPLCAELQAAQGTCPAASRIGTATAGAGAGSEPFRASGPVFLTGAYKGAPFGLSVAIPAVAGPFNFGTVVVRSAIYVDPHTAQITVLSDPLPQMVDTSQTDSGVPVALHSVSIDVDRPGFMFNPTSCKPMAVKGTLGSNRSATSGVSSPFQVDGCQGLAFKPSFRVSTQARTSKTSGASLDVNVASGSRQANIAKVDVSLPKALPSRLTTLQQACTEAQFAANPAACPAASVVGIATAHTPVLSVPLTGPAYLVSHGGAAFPDLVLVLQGEGVTIELVGNTNIKKGITYSRFEAVPDAPFSTFELKLPAGPHSVLAATLPAQAKGSMCAQKLTMPTMITAQSGAQVTQTTRIAVTGCAKGKHEKKKARKAKKVKRAGAERGR
ncbi:MAG: hypothetical protein QOI92_73 [Chloroflexota bacterium]|jgi:hypothetical protein|nr:hypothetical protein [Chloroflexota bacterium]